MHEEEGAAHGLRCIYQRIDLVDLGLNAEALPELLTAAERMGFAGLNITHPCKQDVVPLLTDLSDEARAIGSVNTVVLERGRRFGHNTDRWGFRQSVVKNLPGAAVGLWRDHVAGPSWVVLVRFLVLKIRNVAAPGLD